VSTEPQHAECWQLLPWLANGRLSATERTAVEQHVHGCPACAQELAAQRRVYQTLTAPERVTYAPGPSFRKLLERIDGAAPRAAVRAPRGRRRSDSAALSWRPPGLAWAASVLLLFGAAFWVTGYRWSQPLYVTHTSGAPAAAGVLHIAFVPTLSVVEASALLRASGARIVEGPDASGVFGVRAAQQTGTAEPGGVSPQLRALARRLGADERVRWVEPLPQVEGPVRAPGS
jgi:anti-sigma factor RsiW